MKRITFGLAVGACAAALGTAGNALADPGNTATNSVGTVQVGAVSASPTVDATTPVGDVAVTPATLTDKSGSSHSPQYARIVDELFQSICDAIGS